MPCDNCGRRAVGLQREIASNCMTKVIIVDDSALNREFHSQIARDAGFAAAAAVHGLDALGKAKGEPFDVILTDLNMRGMDGYEFTRRVRQDPGYDEVPIIIISSECPRFDKQISSDAGVDLYQVKPVDGKLLVESILMLLGKL